MMAVIASLVEQSELNLLTGFEIDLSLLTHIALAMGITGEDEQERGATV
jgi:hypothetical protein